MVLFVAVKNCLSPLVLDGMGRLSGDAGVCNDVAYHDDAPSAFVVAPYRLVESPAPDALLESAEIGVVFPSLQTLLSL